jgi:hypothetical protein
VISLMKQPRKQRIAFRVPPNANAAWLETLCLSSAPESRHRDASLSAVECAPESDNAIHPTAPIIFQFGYDVAAGKTRYIHPGGVDI